MTKKYILNGFRAIGIWPLNLEAMIAKTSPSEAFKADFYEQHERDQIFEKGLPMVNNDNIYYYNSKEEEGEQEEGKMNKKRTNSLQRLEFL